jgi:environmental stress-induced protein Ves
MALNKGELTLALKEGELTIRLTELQFFGFPAAQNITSALLFERLHCAHLG